MIRFAVGTTLIILVAVASFTMRFMSIENIYVFLQLGIICVGFLVQLSVLLGQRREINKVAFQAEVIIKYLNQRAELEELRNSRQ